MRKLVSEFKFHDTINILKNKMIKQHAVYLSINIFFIFQYLKKFNNSKSELNKQYTWKLRFVRIIIILLLRESETQKIFINVKACSNF